MKRSSAGGFTIVETLIVLAVSSVLFVALTGAVRGQQSKAQFKNAMTAITSEIQSTIGEVSNGHYPIPQGSFSCTAGATGPQLSAAAGAGLGSNSGCTYMGRAMMFGTGMADDSQQYLTHTLVGLRRTVPQGEDPANFSEARVRVVAPSTSTPSTPDQSMVNVLQFGATVRWMRADDGTNAPVAGFAVVTVPGKQVVGSVGGGSAAAMASVIPVPCGVTPSCTDGLDPRPGAEAIINTFAGANGVNATATGVRLCFLSATSNQSGLVRVGVNGGNNSITMTIHNNTDCA